MALSPTLHLRYFSDSPDFLLLIARLIPPPRHVQLNGNHSYEAEPIDVWGIGVILFALLVGGWFHSIWPSLIIKRRLTDESQIFHGMNLRKKAWSSTTIQEVLYFPKIHGIELESSL